jgi:hypothetical protein
MSASQLTAIIMAAIAAFSQYEVYSDESHFEIRLAKKQAAVDAGYSKYAACKAVNDGA